MLYPFLEQRSFTAHARVLLSYVRLPEWVPSVAIWTTPIKAAAEIQVKASSSDISRWWSRFESEFVSAIFSKDIKS